MGTAALPVFLVTSKHDIKFVGQSGTFKDTYVLVCRECKKNGLRYKREYVRCLSSGAKLEVAETVCTAFAAWVYMIPQKTKPKKSAEPAKPTLLEKTVRKLVKKQKLQVKSRR
jgi:hypothetical protein